MELADQVKLSVMKVMRFGFPSTSTTASTRRKVSGYQIEVRCPFSLMMTSRIILSLGVLSHNFILHIVLGAGDPKNTALEKLPKMFEINVSLVKDDNFAFVDPSAKCRIE